MVSLLLTCIGDADGTSIACQIARAIGSNIEYSFAKEGDFNYDVYVSINGESKAIWLKSRPGIDNIYDYTEEDGELDILRPTPSTPWYEYLDEYIWSLYEDIWSFIMGIYENFGDMLKYLYLWSYTNYESSSSNYYYCLYPENENLDSLLLNEIDSPEINNFYVDMTEDSSLDIMGIGSGSSSGYNSGESFLSNLFNSSSNTESSATSSSQTSEPDWDDEDIKATKLDVNKDKDIVEKKLVYRSDLSIETLDYHASIQSIRNTIEKYDGFIESEKESNNEYNWYYDDYTKTRGTWSNYLTIRIPSANYHNFMNEVNGIGHIIGKNSEVINISQEYYDTKISIETYEAERDRLMDMLNKAYDIDDMITVERRLQEVESQINLLNNQIRHMDSDVAYSYVYISLVEVLEYKPGAAPVKTNTFFDRLKNTLDYAWDDFLYTLEELLFTVIEIVPKLIIWIPVLFVSVKGCRFIFVHLFGTDKKIEIKIFKRNKKKSTMKTQQPNNNNNKNVVDSDNTINTSDTENSQKD